jgi:predicted amidohydrolase YtcJ
MISMAGVTRKWRKPRVSEPEQSKDNIRSNPEVTPRAALEDVTYRSNPAGYKHGATGRITSGAIREL